MPEGTSLLGTQRKLAHLRPILPCVPPTEARKLRVTLLESLAARRRRGRSGG